MSTGLSESETVLIILAIACAWGVVLICRARRAGYEAGRADVIDEIFAGTRGGRGK